MGSLPWGEFIYIYIYIHMRVHKGYTGYIGAMGGGFGF